MLKASGEVPPKDEGPLGVHQVELVVEPGPRLAHGRGVGQSTHCPLHLYTRGVFFLLKRKIDAHILYIDRRCASSVIICVISQSRNLYILLRQGEYSSMYPDCEEELTPWSISGDANWCLFPLLSLLYL